MCDSDFFTIKNSSLCMEYKAEYFSSYNLIFLKKAVHQVQPIVEIKTLALFWG